MRIHLALREVQIPAVDLARVSIRMDMFSKRRGLVEFEDWYCAGGRRLLDLEQEARGETEGSGVPCFGF